MGNIIKRALPLNFKNQNGFSLIEIIIAISIFIMVLTVATTAFVNNSSYQKRITALQDAENNARYILEVMAREIRLARDIDNGQRSIALGDNDFSFKNYKDDAVIYCSSDAGGNCVSGGDYLARMAGGAGQVLNTSSVRIKNLNFITNNFADSPARQKIITIFFTAESANNPDIKIDIQTSVTARIYE